MCRRSFLLLLIATTPAAWAGGHDLAGTIASCEVEPAPALAETLAACLDRPAGAPLGERTLCAAAVLQDEVAAGLLGPAEARELLAAVADLDTSPPGTGLPPKLDIRANHHCGAVPGKEVTEVPFEGKKRTARCVVVWSSPVSRCPVFAAVDEGAMVPVNSGPLMPVGTQRVVCAYATGKGRAKSLLLYCSGRREDGKCHVGVDYLDDLDGSPTTPEEPSAWDRNSGTTKGVCGQPVEKDVVTLVALRENADANPILKDDLCLLVQNTGTCPVKLRWHYEEGTPTSERLGAGGWTKACNQELSPKQLTMECEGERGTCELRWRVVGLGAALSKTPE